MILAPTKDMTVAINHATSVPPCQGTPLETSRASYKLFFPTKDTAVGSDPHWSKMLLLELIMPITVSVLAS